MVVVAAIVDGATILAIWVGTSPVRRGAPLQWAAAAAATSIASNSRPKQ